MAVTSRRSRPIPDRENIVAELARALSAPGSARQPRIITNPQRTLGKVDLIVIWDRWKGIPIHDRSPIILEAFNQANPDKKNRVYTAIGRTTEEAISLGYLPYRIAPAEHLIPATAWDRIDDALRGEGAVETAVGLQLRFERLDEAQDALLRLQEKVPGPNWTIVEEVVRDS